MTIKDPIIHYTHKTPVDLRAALKVQPTNEEAMAELISLLPPERLLKSKPKSKLEPSPPAQSSSSSSKQPESESAPKLAEVNGKQRPKQPKQPPFTRTRADDRKLKVVLIPASAAEMALEEFGRHVKEACVHPQHWGRNGEKDKGKGKGKGNASKVTAGGTGKGKGKVNGKGGRSKFKEMEEIMKSETVTYPSWDRYIVRRTE